MITNSDIEKAIALYESESNKAVMQARKTRLPEPIKLQFKTSSLRAEKIEELTAALPTGYKKEDRDASFIYLLSITESSGVSQAELLSAFQFARDLQASEDYDGKKNLCQYNPDNNESNVLYVGRSYKPRERLKQHLSSSQNGTYAIHFAMWATELEAEISFYLYRYTGLDSRSIQVIEDGLWDYCSPSLGRRGEK